MIIPMPHVVHALRFLLMTVAAVFSVDASAQAHGPASLYDPTQLPVVHGTLELFTLTPLGDIEGFVLADGTEVKTPPHLTADLAAIVGPGDRVTVHGLRAASLPLVQAMSVGNDATGALVIDAGPNPGRHPQPPPRWDAAGATTVEGQVRMVLHGPRGDLNGALLQNGTVLRLPAPEARRFTALLVAGRTLEARGQRGTTPYGSFIDLTSLGPAGGPLEPVSARPHASLTSGTPMPGR